MEQVQEGGKLDTYVWACRVTEPSGPRNCPSERTREREREEAELERNAKQAKFEIAKCVDKLREPVLAQVLNCLQTGSKGLSFVSAHVLHMSSA